MNKPTPGTAWVYLRSEANLWTVGFYAPDGRWQPESDYNSKEEAAQRVAWLNGGPESISHQSLRRCWEACHSINPDNPLAVAEAMGEVVSCCAEALTTLSHLGYGDSPMAQKIRVALAKLEKKA
jgi:hypothetical protein